jgi:branched-chain amino acid transport system substrate-binding protein
VDSTDVVAVIGHVTSGAMVSAAKVYDGRLAAVATTASTPDLTGISPWAFRVISSDSANGISIARWAAGRGITRVAILYENNSYGRGLADAFRTAFRGEVLTMDPIADVADQNFEPHVAYLRSVAPDLVFVAGTEASGIGFLREARRQRLDALFVGGDGWSSVAGDPVASEGAWVGSPFSATDTRPRARTFVAAFRERYGIAPDGNAALAYDATMLLAAAVREAGADRAAVQRHLRGLRPGREFQGVTGAIAFTDGGDPLDKQIVMERITRGALTAEVQ